MAGYSWDQPINLNTQSLALPNMQRQSPETYQFKTGYQYNPNAPSAWDNINNPNASSAWDTAGNQAFDNIATGAMAGGGPMDTLKGWGKNMMGLVRSMDPKNNSFMGGLGTAFDIGKGIYGMYNASKTRSMAKKWYDFQKNLAIANYDNQVTMLNDQTATHNAGLRMGGFKNQDKKLKHSPDYVG